MNNEPNFFYQDQQLDQVIFEEDEMALFNNNDIPLRESRVIDYFAYLENATANINGEGQTSTNQANESLPSQIPANYDTISNFSNERESLPFSNNSSEYYQNNNRNEQSAHLDNNSHVHSQGLQYQQSYFLSAAQIFTNNNQSIMREGMNEISSNIFEGSSWTQGMNLNQIYNNGFQYNQRRTHNDLKTCKVCWKSYKNLSGLFNHVRTKHTKQGEKVNVRQFAVRNSERVGRPRTVFNQNNQ